MSDGLEVHEPTREQIERRAYEIYLARGGEHGSDLADWVMAEQDLKILPTNSPSKTTRNSDRAQDASS